jgi:hypothetical protein
MQFKIEELVKDRKVRWGSTHNSNPAWLTSKITFGIAQVQKVSLVNFLHTDFPENYNCEYENTFWDKCLQSLKRYCETGEGSPLV